MNWSNIKEKAHFNFKQFVAHVSMFNTPYDYGSIMHYSPAAFAIDTSVPTLVPLFPAENLGQREGKLLFVIPSTLFKRRRRLAMYLKCRLLIIFRIFSASNSDE